MMVVYPGLLSPPYHISVVILPSDVVYMTVVYAIVGGGLLILSIDGIIIIALWGVDGGGRVSTITI